MACVHPIPAYRTQAGAVTLYKGPHDAISLRLPCGGCIGCRMARAQQWALRCRLELQRHASAVFATVTYDDAHLPQFSSLDRRDLQVWLRRMRRALRPAARGLRFFACGEYGEQNHRPHYHAILFGLHQDRDGDLIETAWGKGRTHMGDVTPASIGYVAGYSSKKLGWRRTPQLITDPETGEVLYEWQPPFIQMSRKPGIAGHARQWPESWRLYAVENGFKIPVPRYLHESWKKQATPAQLEDLLFLKSQLPHSDTSETRLRAAEQILLSKHALAGAGRQL